MVVYATLLAGCEPAHMTRVALWCVWFVFLHIVGKTLGRYSPLLKSRPTVVGGTFHGWSTSWLAVAVHFGLLPLSWWRTVGIPLSGAYLITDTVFYCFAKGDLPMVVHHGVMLAAHWCVGSIEASVIGGAGDAEWAARLSVAGYLSELPNPLLNVRWFMTKTLKKHNPLFTINNILLLIFWVGSRLMYMPYIVVAWVVPRYDDYKKVDGLDAWASNILCHLVIVVMSLHWLLQLLRGGLKPLLVFDPNSSGFNPNLRDNIKESPPAAAVEKKSD